MEVGSRASQAPFSQRDGRDNALAERGCKLNCLSRAQNANAVYIKMAANCRSMGRQSDGDNANHPWPHSHQVKRWLNTNTHITFVEPVHNVLGPLSVALL
jgi:hypothetical protein